MTAPPPIPVECKLMTPEQKSVAIAASTAEPFFLKIFAPTFEQRTSSAATEAFA